MPDTGIWTQTDGGQVVITIDRPPVNALDTYAITALREAFETALKDQPVILTGAGTAFSAGVDTRAFAGYSGEQKAEMVLAITQLTAAILAHPAPVVAAVNGHALGGGFVLMLACDVRIVATDPAARFGLTEARAGVPFPAGPLDIIRHEVAPGLLRRLTLTSETISSADLIAHDLADAACDLNGLLALAYERAAQTASQPAFAMVKQQMRGGLIERVVALANSGDDPLAKMLKSTA